MNCTESRLHSFDDPEAASLALCREIAEEAGQAVSRYGDFRLVLAGGSTPVRLYEIMAEDTAGPDIPWPAVHLFWGDERFLPPSHRKSNYYLAAKTMLHRVPLRPEHIHRVPVEERTVLEAARCYDVMLRNCETEGRPLFDLTLLGMGEDGHTASLFPGHPVLDDECRLAAAVTESAGSPPVPRITLTLKGLAGSSRICFLIVGEKKRRIMEKIRSGGWEQIFPAARVRALDRLDWYVA